MALTGIFGGTFDPVHLGHLRTAMDLLDALPLREVRFMLCGIPPHRVSPLAPAKIRWAMLQAALASDPRLVADDRELYRDGPSYTVDSLESLRADFKEQHLALILGMDAFGSLDTWYRWQDILSLAHLVVVQRPGSRLRSSGVPARLLADHGCEDPAELINADRGRIFTATMTQLEISSSAIRELAIAGRDPRYLVTDSVREIMMSSGCYGPHAQETQTKKEVLFGAK
jgi:nicotinate-nucleotide adenylyltransferase